MDLEGFFSIAIVSRTAEAEKFRTWVCGELLPQLFEEGFYTLKYKMEVVKGEVVAVTNEIKLLDNEMDRVKEIWHDLIVALERYKREKTPSRKESISFADDLMKHSNMIVELLTKNKVLVVENIEYKRQVKNLIVEAAYWKSITDKYIPSEIGYIYFMEVEVLEEGQEEVGYKIGRTDDMANRMKDYRTGNVKVCLVAYFPMAFSNPLLIETGIKVLVQNKVYRYRTETFYRVGLEYLIRRTAILIKLQQESYEDTLENEHAKIKVMRIKENYKEDADSYGRFVEETVNVSVDAKLEPDEDEDYTSDSDISDTEEFVTRKKT